MKHLQELEIGLKMIDFSHNHDCGEKWLNKSQWDLQGNWRTSSEVERKEGVCRGQVVEGLRFTQ